MRPPWHRGASWLAAHGGGVAAIAFLAHGLATLADYGITWDERESYRAGAQNLQLIGAALGGGPLPSWPWHELPGYQFAADALRAAGAAVVNRLFWEPGSYLGSHLVNLLACTLAVWVVARIAVREGAARSGLGAHTGDDSWRSDSGGRVLAPLAVLLLVLQPKLVAHSQANPKDVVGLLAFAAAVLALSRASQGRWRDYALLGLAIGAALASHVSGVLLVPLAVVWLAAAGSGPWRRRLAGLSLAIALAAATAFLLWPWLWPAPWQRGQYLLARVQSFDVPEPMRVLYLGDVYRPGDVPWHYGLVSLAIATPVPLLLAALAGLVCAVRGGPAARLCRLAVLWFALFVLADLRAPVHYDGARHLVPALPALALLAAGGVYATGLALWRAASRAADPASSRRRRRATLALGAVFMTSLLAIAFDLAAIHPYADAYLSAPARLALGPEAQRRVELEYWCNSYKEGAEWLADHAPLGSFVLVPMGPHAALPFLGGFQLVPHDGWPYDGRPQYLMLMTREAWYTPRLRHVVDTHRPLHVVRRQGSTLLAIYRVEPIDAPPRR